jgi:hypothetical protein
VAQDKQEVIAELRRLGYQEAADAAVRELPDEVTQRDLEEFGNRHNLSRDELVNRMGGSP